ncbi:hypothetical protein K502DRAFT_116691 [Neoconidiobolus thromboides FSU 785]|nr:hypothetical protein K502DRAFT_116691 [Neoconidiobolus thromboides FSU 785]
MYHNLEYLKTKRFRREDYLLTFYSNIVDEINSIENFYIARAKDTPSLVSSYLNKKSEFQDLFNSIKEVIKLRKYLIKGYKLLVNNTEFVPFLTWLDLIEEAFFHFEYYHFSKVMEQFVLVIKYELLILKYLIHSQLSIAKLDFKKSILNFYKTHQYYILWKTFLKDNLKEDEINDKDNNNKNDTTTNNNNDNNNSSLNINMFSFITSIAELSFSNGNKQQSKLKISKLMHWLELFYDHLLAKLTLYFHYPLLDMELKLNNGNGKSLWKNVLAIDYPLMFKNFIKKSGAYHISLIYQTDKEQRYSKKGFICENMAYEPLIGLESFPFLFSYPNDLPKEYRPALISMIMSNDQNQYKIQTHNDLTSPISNSSSTIFTNDNNHTIIHNSTISQSNSNYNTLNLPGSNVLSNLMKTSGLGFNLSSTTSQQTSTVTSPEYQQNTITLNNSSTLLTTSSRSICIKQEDYLLEPIHFYDRIMNSTFYLTKIDTKVTLAVIFQEKHIKKDLKVWNFLLNLSHRLRCSYATSCLLNMEFKNSTSNTLPKSTSSTSKGGTGGSYF